MMKQVIIPILLLAAIVTVQQAHAFPCSGGSGKSYCSGYHRGALNADKDNNQGWNDVDKDPCPSGHTADYCSGYTRGYNDEAGFFQ